MEIQNYVDKTLLGWIYYNENYTHGENTNAINRVCYVYPRYILVDDETVVPIDPADFPMLGSFEVRIQGGFSAEDVVDKLSHLVKAKLNIMPEEDKDQQNNHYRLKFNPTYSEGISEVWLEGFKDSNFYQVVKTDLSIEDILKRKSIDYFLDNIYTKHIVVKNKEGYFGPFDYYVENNQIKLFATDKFDYHILKPNPAIISKEVLRIGDRADNGVDLVMAKSMSESADLKDSYDFINDTTLLDKILSIFEERKMTDRNQIKELKKLLLTQIDPEKYPDITENRLIKLKELIRSSEYQDDFLSKISYYLMEDEENRDYVLRKILDTRFEELEDRSTRFIEVRERLDELNREKANLESTLETIRSEVSDAKSFILKENEELSNKLNMEIDALKKKRDELDSEINSLVGIYDLATADSVLKQDISAREAQINELSQTRDSILKELKDGIEEFNNTGRVIGRALKEKGFNDILMTVRGTKNFEYIPYKDVSYANFESKDEIIDYILYKMNKVYNHRISRNGVINLLALFAQNFIVNFDGKTGSGKTSRATAFLNALGLNSQNNRFVRINVDPDVRSVRDLVGFYNPNTGEIVKNNRRLYDLLEMMEKDTEDVLSCVLFDNVNSSIPEHYLSGFIDKKINETMNISLGGGREFEIKPSLRILTTITDDHTGFILSDRFYDNSATSTQNYDGRSVYKLNNLEFEDRGAVSYSDIMTFNEKKSFSNDFEIKFNSLMSIFRKNGAYISSRSEEKARDYIESVQDMMDLTSPMQKFFPIELAISQFILPNLNLDKMNDRFFSGILNELKNMQLLESRFKDIKATKDRIDIESRLDF